MGDPAASPGVRWNIRRFDEIDSTNQYVLDAARGGAEAGLVVVADHQRAGRGRRGRSWIAPAGSSLLVSVLLRPRLAADEVQLVTMAAAPALRRAGREDARAAADLKWPNDLLLADHNLAARLPPPDV